MPPQILETKRKHTSYDDWADVAGFLWPSYLGGKAYQEADQLDKYPRELDVVHAARKKRAYYLNFFGAVVDAYVSAVYRRDPVREPGEEDGELSSAFASFVDNATGDGTHLNEFSREVVTFALAAERAFVAVDIGANGFPYTHMIHPANLFDFSEARDGSLNWAIVAEKAVVDGDPFKDRDEQDRFRLWMPDEWILFDKRGQEIDRQRNSAGRVPIVAVPGHTVGFPSYDAALINKRIYNLCSQLDEILVNVTFPQMYTQAGEGVEGADGEAISPDVQPLAIGTGRILLLPDEASMPPGFLAPPNGPAEMHMQERERLIGAIYSLAGLERKDPDSQQVQSGVAKAYDFRETNERLVSLAQLAEEFEVEVFDLLKAYGVSGEVNVTYQKDFNVRDFNSQLDNYLKIAGANGIPAQAKRRAALDVSMSIAEEATEDEKKDIREAVEAQGDASFTGRQSVGSLLGEGGLR